MSRAVGDLETLPPDKSAAMLGRRELEVQRGNGESRVGWRQTLTGGGKDSERSELFGKQRRQLSKLTDPSTGWPRCLHARARGSLTVVRGPGPS